MAGDLEAGDRILTLDGSYGTVEALEVVEQTQVMYDLTVAEAHTFAVGDGQWVVHNCEFFYRAMSETEYRRVKEIGGLVKRSEGSNELFITTSRDYAFDLFNRRRGKRQYPIVIEFELEVGTESMLLKLGATHNSAQSIYPHLPPFKSGMNAVQVKFEKLGNISIPSFAVGHSSEALKMFNEMIIRLTRLER